MDRRVSHDGTTRFLIERYWPGATVDEFHAASARLGSTIASMVAAGEPIELIRSTFVPDDQSAYWLVAASSRDSVRSACDVAGVVVQRLLDVVDSGAPVHGDVGERPDTTRSAR